MFCRWNWSSMLGTRSCCVVAVAGGGGCCRWLHVGRLQGGCCRVAAAGADSHPATATAATLGQAATQTTAPRLHTLSCIKSL